jgi:hypothetical protein
VTSAGPFTIHPGRTEGKVKIQHSPVGADVTTVQEKYPDLKRSVREPRVRPTYDTAALPALFTRHRAGQFAEPCTTANSPA